VESLLEPEPKTLIRPGHQFRSILDKTENPEKTYHTSLIAPSRSTVAPIVQ